MEGNVWWRGQWRGAAVVVVLVMERAFMMALYTQLVLTASLPLS